MDFIFKDRAFDGEARRVAGLAGEAGADVAEVVATAARIVDGDEESWTAAWAATAALTAQRGEESLTAADSVSAREAFLRASNYYRVAESFRREDPLDDPLARQLSRCSRDYFVRGCELLAAPFREVSIPYEGGELPGYLFVVDDDGQPRPTVIYTGGVDSTREEGYFVIGAAALRRGYNFLAYDGPGQGLMIRERGVAMRPDWENVLGAVVDFAATVPEIDDARLVQFGHCLGGYLVARYAAHDHRSAAIVCHHAMTTFYASYPAVPEPILGLIEDDLDDEAEPVLEVWIKEDTGARQALRHGQWVFGVDSPIGYVRRTAEYGVTARQVGRIRTPVLLLEGEADTAYAGQATNFARAMNAPVRQVVLRNVDDSGESCHQGAAFSWQQNVFNHLARTLG